MRILAFDTATRATAVALVDDDQGIELEARDDPPAGQRPAHATRLLALIDGVLRRAGGGWERIDRIAVGVGPGTFTGLRIGVATSRALARARALPLVGVSTLQSLAMNAAGSDSVDAVLAVLDARRGEVFAAAWRPAELRDREHALLNAAALAPERLAEVVPGLGAATLALGDGAVEFREVLERSGASIPEDDSQRHRVTAVNHCRLAGRLDVVDPDQVRPHYLRLPDAEIARRSRRSR
jgi:tRNA threonylcarbamoyladenosine biosynthesis protein TsaB